jgi:hypothetical protein
MIECFDFLCDLKISHPSHFYIMYGFGYDFTEILHELFEPQAWEIQNQMSYTNKELHPEDRDDPSLDWISYVFLKRPNGEDVCYGVSYLKSKWFKIGRISNVSKAAIVQRLIDSPRAHPGFDNGVVEIHDTVSFFQTSFLAAMDGMKSSINVAPRDRELIEWGKPRRGVFVNERMVEIIAYNQAELNVLDKMMNAFREALLKLPIPIKLRVWYGPGAVAKELLDKTGILPKRGKWNKRDGHYPEWLAATQPTVAQQWSHYAFSGGNIDLLHQGVHQDPDMPIHYADITSAYPSIAVDLPSMFGGKYKHVKASDLDLDAFEKMIEGSNMLSMFEIKWEFKKGLTTYEEIIEANTPFVEIGPNKGKTRQTEPPFYPLFYRTNGHKADQSDEAAKITAAYTGVAVNYDANILLYPQHGWGRYYRAEALAAIEWCKVFPWAVIKFEFKGAQLFTPKDPSLRPFAFVQDLFDLRAKIVAETKAAVKAWEASDCVGDEPYNILEQVIKLVLNSIYGKMAQSLGTRGKLPRATNPFYAGAITAGTRAKLKMASLKDPWRVISFATDAIFSAGPIRGLEYTDKKILGTWEHAGEADVHEAGIFLHPGFYSFFDLKKGEYTKMRGCKVEFGREFLSRDVRDAWRKGDKFFITYRKGEAPREVSNKEYYRATQPKGVIIHDPENKLSMPATNLITMGVSLISEENWVKCGTWATRNRDLDLNSCGTKRGRNRAKARANFLVPVLARDTLENDILSKPYYPDWLAEETMDEFNATAEADEIASDYFAMEL